MCAMLLQIHAIKGKATIRVLENTVDPEAFGVVGGATLDKIGLTGTSDVLDGFAMCSRFKLKILGHTVPSISLDHATVSPSHL